jgi:uncharacterized membrane protein YphA (DoxX/SURF4 family)
VPTKVARSRLDPVAPVISTLARLLLAGVLLVAGGLKAADPQTAVQAVRAYRLLPSSLQSPIGWGLPFFEIALGLLLAVGIFPRIVSSVSAALLVVFIAAVSSAAARGLSIDCGCFGGGGTVAPGKTKYVSEIIRDVALLILASWLIWRPRSRFSLERAELEEEL